MLSVRSNVSACLAVSFLLTAACARHRFEDNPKLAPPQELISGPVVLEVENHNWSDIVLFVIHDGRTQRLAQIAAARDAQFEIPSHLIGDQGVIRLGLHRIGGRDDYRTEAVSVRTGTTIRLTIEGKLEHSSIGVW
ncbi:MAG TPA: hypothetical protein VJ852_08355 [Gemmatimonadaceae bacterium]|nr:hypothetical protein [Gemmatimonadaceae bacterium]